MQPGGPVRQPYSYSVPIALTDCSKIPVQVSNCRKSCLVYKAGPIYLFYRRARQQGVSRKLMKSCSVNFAKNQLNDKISRNTVRFRTAKSHSARNVDSVKCVGKFFCWFPRRLSCKMNEKIFKEGWIFTFLAGYCFAKAFKLSKRFREGLTFREIVQRHDHPRRQSLTDSQTTKKSTHAVSSPPLPMN